MDTSQYRLKSMKNAELVSGLSHIVQQGNLLTADLLAHLGELEERMLHLELGFPSLFAYCVQSLGMSEGAAGRRVAAAHVCRRFPDAFDRIASGALHLSALCALGPHLKPENATELLHACRRKTRRQVEELLAARFPKPDIREQIRRLPDRKPAPPLISVPTPEHAEPGAQSVSAPPVSAQSVSGAAGIRAAAGAFAAPSRDRTSGSRALRCAFHG
ncbi:MAG TPA: hypothetical protein VHW01_30055 [Polyangiaceae bacterium]|jgi:hypothetical protein|nr:hypothetical protein [Polyangiaceae bacterium]